MAHAMGNVEERPANWLPIPGDEPEVSRRRAVVDENDLFSKGEMASYHKRQGEGFVKTAHDKLLPFSAVQGTVIGDVENLEKGARVGYDASMTRHGMRVTILKVY